MRVHDVQRVLLSGYQQNIDEIRRCFVVIVAFFVSVALCEDFRAHGVGLPLTILN